MTKSIPTEIDELIEYLAAKATPQEILDFQFSAAIQQRTDTLINRQDAGELSLEEQRELDQLRYFYQLVSLLQTEALERRNQA